MTILLSLLLSLGWALQGAHAQAYPAKPLPPPQPYCGGLPECNPPAPRDGG